VSTAYYYKNPELAGCTLHPVIMAKWLCPPTYFKNPEVAGFILNGPGRGTLYTSYIFLSVALQDLAFKDAGCLSQVCPIMNGTQPYREEYYDDDDDRYVFDDDFVTEYYKCDKKTNGFRPSSLIALMTTVANIISVIGLPILGAVVDFTQYRKLMGQVLISVAVLGNLMQVGISEDTWIFMAAIQALLKIFIDGHQLCMFAYIGELSQDPENELPQIQSYAKMWNDFCCLLYIIIVGTMEFPKKEHAHPDGCDDVVGIAVVGQIVACTVGAVLCFLSWSKMRPRPAMREVPEGKSILTVGFSELSSTLCGLWKEYPDVFIFLCGLCFWSSATEALFAVVIPYLTIQLRVGSLFIYFILEVLFFFIVGAALYPIVTKRLGLNMALKVIIVMFAVVDVIFPFLCNSPDDMGVAWIFGAIFGIMMGLIFPAQRSMYYNIIPAGREAELTGVYMFCLYVLNSLPTFIFYQVNEATNNLQYGFSALVLMYMIGLAVLVLGGFDYERAKEKMQMTVGERYFVGANGEVKKGCDSDQESGTEPAPLSGAAIVPVAEH